MSTSETSTWKKLFTREMMIIGLLGFSSGLPAVLTRSTMQAWMTQAGVDLKTIGLFALVRIPFSLKFLWAPLFDRYSLLGYGRRKSWLFCLQFLLSLALFLISNTDPKAQTLQIVILALLFNLFSASQDTIVDAHRRESLQDEQLGVGVSFYSYGYRIAMWIAGGFALGLAGMFSYSIVYKVMALIMLSMTLVTWFSKEPHVESQPKNLKEAVIDPFLDYFRKPGAFLILLFILLYKLGDNMAGNMLMSFYLKQGYTNIEVATVAKTYSMVAALLGSFVGGIVVLRAGIIPSLWTFGILQATSTAAFSWLATMEHNMLAFGTVVCFEDFSSAMGSAAFVAFMATETNKKFTATQYALLSSLAMVPGTMISSVAGYLEEAMGWHLFFMACGIMAIPGLLMIFVMSKMQKIRTNKAVEDIEAPAVIVKI